MHVGDMVGDDRRRDVRRGVRRTQWAGLDTGFQRARATAPARAPKSERNMNNHVPHRRPVLVLPLPCPTWRGPVATLPGQDDRGTPIWCFNDTLCV